VELEVGGAGTDPSIMMMKERRLSFKASDIVHLSC
jgi:hypothetical protein